MVSSHFAIWSATARGSVLNLRWAWLPLALGVSICFAGADSFGRFGYGAVPSLPDLKVDQNGLRANAEGASRLDFAAPLTRFSPTITHSTEQVSLTQGAAGSPKKIRTSLAGNSVDLYFDNGLSLICKSQQPPFLSWGEGSVGPQVPTPDSQWLLLSFSTPEPPYILGFSGAVASLKTTGSPLQWRIADPKFTGWVRVWLPLGLDPQFGIDAASLGQLSKLVGPFERVWKSPTPEITRVDVKEDEQGIDATWVYNGPGGFLPMAPQMAQLGGSAIAILSKYQLLPGAGYSGPYSVAEGTQLTIHFPVRRVELGRAIGLGVPPRDVLSSASIYDPPSIVELACESLLAYGDSTFTKLADDTLTRFLNETPYSVEPNTKQQLPFAADGAGLELAAAHALLSQAQLVAAGSKQANALYDSILWRRDWWSWMILTPDNQTARKVTALAALAGALSQDPLTRLSAATLEAGLDAQRGEQIWRRRRHLAVRNELAEPLLGLREGFFALRRIYDPGVSFYQLIQSPMRSGTGPPLVLRKEQDGLILEWKAEEKKESYLHFYVKAALTVSAKENLKKVLVTPEGKAQKLTYLPVIPGLCSVQISLPAGQAPIPPEVSPPSY